MIAPAPSLHQTENHIIDPLYEWTKTGQLSKTELQHLVETPPTLWANGDSTYYGENDRVTLDIASKMTNSLWLIDPVNLNILVSRNL